MAGEKETPELFGIYYLNYSKVIELNMIMNNHVKRTMVTENGGASSFSSSGRVSGDISAGIAPVHKARVSSSLEDSYAESTKSSVQETFDVKQTKSTELNKLMPLVREIGSDLTDLESGSLVKIDGVSLHLLDDGQLSVISAIRHDAFDGFRVQGMNVDSLMNSLLQDYAYVLVGDCGNDRFSFKIPSESKNEFENKYGIRDLLLGKVSVIGVYKGMVKASSLRESTFTELQAAGSSSSQPTKVMKSERFALTASEEVAAPLAQEDIAFIDLIAVIQPIVPSVGDDCEEVEAGSRKRPSLLQVLRRWFKGDLDE